MRLRIRREGDRNGGRDTWKERGDWRGGGRRSSREKGAEEEGDGKRSKPNLPLAPPRPAQRLQSPATAPWRALARSLAYLLLAPAGSRLRPHQEAPRSYKFRLPSSQAASAATCAAAHSQGQ